MNSIAPPEWDMILSAAQKNSAERIKMLVESGVSPSHANGVGQSALHVAALWANGTCTTAMTFLLRLELTLSPLVEAVECLLEHGANANAQNNLTGATPLHMAVSSNKGSKAKQLGTILLLLQNGADKSIPDNYGGLPVDAIRVEEHDEDHFSALQKLLEPTLPDLFQAIKAVDVAKVQTLLANKETCASIVEEKHTDMVPLLYTIQLIVETCETEGEIDVGPLTKIAGALLDAKANPNVKSGTDMEPVEPPLLQVLQILRDLYGDELNEPNVQCLEDLAVQLVECRADVDSSVASILHTAARRNSCRLIKLLIVRLKVDVNTRNHQGMTALQFAARSGRVEALHELLQVDGIEINAKDARGQTALQAAKVNERDAVVAILREHGAVED